MTERKLRKQVERYLKSLSKCWFYHPADIWTVGLPDFFICYRGKFYAVELKREGKPLRKIQGYILTKIKKALGKTIVAYSVDDVKKLLHENREQDS